MRGWKRDTLVTVYWFGIRHMINLLHLSMVNESLTRLPRCDVTALSSSSLIQYFEYLDDTVSSTNLRL
jgi:hypothetical protein